MHAIIPHCKLDCACGIADACRVLASPQSQRDLCGSPNWIMDWRIGVKLGARLVSFFLESFLARWVKRYGGSMDLRRNNLPDRSGLRDQRG
jgi:hypothetical protein